MEEIEEHRRTEMTRSVDKVVYLALMDGIVCGDGRTKVLLDNGRQSWRCGVGMLDSLLSKAGTRKYAVCSTKVWA